MVCCVSATHLHRYRVEFDIRYNMAQGKRLRAL